MYTNIDTRYIHRNVYAQKHAHVHTHKYSLTALLHKVMGRSRTHANLQVLLPVLLPDEGTFDAVWGSDTSVSSCRFFLSMFFFDFQHIPTLIFRIFKINVPNKDLHLFLRYIRVLRGRLVSAATSGLHSQGLRR